MTAMTSALGLKTPKKRMGLGMIWALLWSSFCTKGASFEKEAPNVGTRNEVATPTKVALKKGGLKKLPLQYGQLGHNKLGQ